MSIQLANDSLSNQVPYDQIRYVLKDQHGTSRSYKIAFPGQAGVPADSLGYDEYYRTVGFTNGPRGNPGKPGLDCEGKPLGKS